jgi:hypothetical protein
MFAPNTPSSVSTRTSQKVCGGITARIASKTPGRGGPPGGGVGVRGETGGRGLVRSGSVITE